MTVPPRTPVLDPHPLGPKEVTWWGMLGLITIEIVIFSGLIAIYFYLKLYNPEWPPEGIDKKQLLLPTINTFILILSSVSVYFADKGIKEGKQTQLKVGQALAMLFGLVFLTIKYIEYSGYDYNWATHAYGSITWTMTGFHSAHVISVFLKGMVVLVMALRGMFTPERHVAVQINGLYWHFVVVIWIPLYFTMYISPHL